MGHEPDARHAEGGKGVADAGSIKAQAETSAITIAEAMSDTREDLVSKDFLRGELAMLRSEPNSEVARVNSELIHWVLESQVLLIISLVALTNFTKLVG